MLVKHLGTGWQSGGRLVLRGVGMGPSFSCSAQGLKGTIGSHARSLLRGASIQKCLSGPWNGFVVREVGAQDTMGEVGDLIGAGALRGSCLLFCFNGEHCCGGGGFPGITVAYFPKLCFGNPSSLILY